MRFPEIPQKAMAARTPLLLFVLLAAAAVSARPPTSTHTVRAGHHHNEEDDDNARMSGAKVCTHSHANIQTYKNAHKEASTRLRLNWFQATHSASAVLRALEEDEDKGGTLHYPSIPSLTDACVLPGHIRSEIARLSAVAKSTRNAGERGLFDCLCFVCFFGGRNREREREREGMRSVFGFMWMFSKRFDLSINHFRIQPICSEQNRRASRFIANHFVPKLI